MIDPKKILSDKHILPRALDIFVPFVELLQSAKFGDDLLVPLSGYRDPQEQAELYKIGRSIPGTIVTNALPLQSFHCFGLAIDFALWNGKLGLGFANPPQPDIHPAWEFLELCCSEFPEISWGGHFKMKDKPHVEIHFGLSLKHLKSAFENFGWDGVVSLLRDE